MVKWYGITVLSLKFDAENTMKKKGVRIVLVS